MLRNSSISALQIFFNTFSNNEFSRWCIDFSRRKLINTNKYVVYSEILEWVLEDNFSKHCRTQTGKFLTFILR